MVMIKLTGIGINEWFAEQLVKDLGADAAREKTCGPSREAVERVIKRAEDDARDHAYEISRRHG